MNFFDHTDLIEAYGLSLESKCAEHVWHRPWVSMRDAFVHQGVLIGATNARAQFFGMINCVLLS